MTTTVAQGTLWSARNTLTIGAVAIIAYTIANVAHEGSHGLACLAVGAKPIAFSAIYFGCDEAGVDGSLLKWIPAAGTLANLVLAAVGLVGLRMKRRFASTARFFWWLFFTVNALQAAGYWLFSGVANIGDWAKVVRGLEPPWVWRVGLTTLGAASYVGVIRVSLAELLVFLPARQRRADARRLMLTPYFVGGALYVAAGLLNPLGVELVLISAAAASFGGTSALGWMSSLVDSPRWAGATTGASFTPSASVAWAVSAFAVAALFIGVLGPAIVFSQGARISPVDDGGALEKRRGDFGSQFDAVSSLSAQSSTVSTTAPRFQCEMK